MFHLEVFLNPLDLAIGDVPDGALQFMCTPGVAPDAASLRARYQEVDAVQPPFLALPTDERILSQLVWPLRHAKASYVVGNYLGAIALAGTVAEMSAILTFDLVGFSFNQKLLTAAAQKHFFGRSFARLGQERRLEILKALGVPAEALAEYEQIRSIRNAHLHVVPIMDEAALAGDARTVFRAAVTVVARTIGPGVKDGKFVFTPQMARYLDRMGRVTRSEDAAAGEES